MLRPDEIDQNTSIHTHILGSVRISSIYRNWDSFDGFGWETLVWDGNMLIDQLPVYNDTESVVMEHKAYRDNWMKEYMERSKSK